MNIRILWLLGLIMSTMLSFAQRDLSVDEYINLYKHIAMEEMETSGIPASITLAQGILESRFGNSRLAVQGNNHFGIKCHDWNGKRMYHDDDARGECFRVYRNANESYRDHSDFLQTRSRYSSLFNYSTTDYKKWAHGLKSAGYATNPKYATILINLIEKHQLHLYDKPERKLFASKNHNERDRSNVKVSSDKTYKVSENKVYSTTKMDNNSAIQVFTYNRIKTIKVAKNDNIQSIASRNYVPVSRLFKYNDLKPGHEIKVGEFIYLQPKRGKAGHKYHVVKNDQTLWDISQLYGIKLSNLYDRNMLRVGEEPAIGETISLNKKVSKKPALRRYSANKPPKVARNKEKESEKNEELIEVIDNAEKAMEMAEKKNRTEDLDRLATGAEAAMKKAEEEARQKAAQEAALKREAAARAWKAEEEAKRLEKERALKAEKEAKQIEAERLKKEQALIKEEAAAASDDIPVAVARKSADEIERDRIEIEKNRIEKEKSRLVYKVVKGDSLYAISRKYGVTIDEIKKWNRLTSNNLAIGQELEIFGK